MEDRIRLEELYGRNVFTLSKMKERLPKSVYRNVLEVMRGGGELSRADADVVAKAMKDWAMENGATHYTHCSCRIGIRLFTGKKVNRNRC